MLCICRASAGNSFRSIQDPSEYRGTSQHCLVQRCIRMLPLFVMVRRTKLSKWHGVQDCCRQAGAASVAYRGLPVKSGLTVKHGLLLQGSIILCPGQHWCSPAGLFACCFLPPLSPLPPLLPLQPDHVMHALSWRQRADIGACATHTQLNCSAEKDTPQLRGCDRVHNQHACMAGCRCWQTHSSLQHVLSR